MSNTLDEAEKNFEDITAKLYKIAIDKAAPGGDMTCNTVVELLPDGTVRIKAIKYEDIYEQH